MCSQIVKDKNSILDPFSTIKGKTAFVDIQNGSPGE